MEELDPNFREFIELLDANQVEYLLIGGYAVNIHAEPRATVDIDFWLNNSKLNSEKIIKTLHDFGFTNLNVTAKNFQEEDFIFQIGNPPLRIDLFTKIPGVEFDSCWKNRMTLNVGNLVVEVISKDDLIKNKESSARDKDDFDLIQLRKKKKN